MAHIARLFCCFLLASAIVAGWAWLRIFNSQSVLKAPAAATRPGTPVLEMKPPPTFEDFVRDIYAQAKPVVLRGALGKAAVRGVNLDGIRREFSSHGVEFALTRGVGCGPRNPHERRFNWTMKEAEGYRKWHPEPKPHLMIIQHTLPSTRVYDTILKNLAPALWHFSYLRDVRLWVNFGDAMTGTGLHFDREDNLFLALEGQKSFVVYAFEDGQFLHVDPQWTPYSKTIFNLYATASNLSHEVRRRWLEPDLADPQRFPDFARATRHEVDLEPGDVLYIPGGFWHSGLHNGTTVGINMWFGLPSPFVDAIDSLILRGPEENEEAPFYMPALPVAEAAIRFPKARRQVEDHDGSLDDEIHAITAARQRSLGRRCARVGSLRHFERALAPFGPEMRCIRHWFRQHWHRLARLVDRKPRDAYSAQLSRAKAWEMTTRLIVGACGRDVTEDLIERKRFTHKRSLDRIFTGCAKRGTCEEASRAARSAARSVVRWVPCAEGSGGSPEL